MSDSPWQAIEAAERPTLTELFARDPDRLGLLTLEAAGLYFDWSKTHLDAGLLDAFEKLADARDLVGKRGALFAGDIVNPSEGRAAEHTAERGHGDADSVARAKQLRGRMRALVDAVEAGAFGAIRHVLHLGIGGSALGPELVIDALGADGGPYETAIVSNVDGIALERATRRFDPNHT
ncbi:MAG: glucose-6-phosphate isomerase, partial [Sphingomonadales bacterium]|nr:glucose-6-phosphate isomerase [Sphingomonadales bacterium]